MATKTQDGIITAVTLTTTLGLGGLSYASLKFFPEDIAVAAATAIGFTTLVIGTFAIIKLMGFVTSFFGNNEGGNVIKGNFSKDRENDNQVNGPSNTLLNENDNPPVTSQKNNMAVTQESSSNYSSGGSNATFGSRFKKLLGFNNK